MAFNPPGSPSNDYVFYLDLNEPEIGYESNDDINMQPIATEEEVESWKTQGFFDYSEQEFGVHYNIPGHLVSDYFTEMEERREEEDGLESDAENFDYIPAGTAEDPIIID